MNKPQTPPTPPVTYTQTLPQYVQTLPVYNQGQGANQPKQPKNRNLGFTLASLLVVVVLAWVVRRRWLEQAENKALAQSFGKDKHATWAMNFAYAFQNDGFWGTQVSKVRETMLEIPSKEDFYKVDKWYKKMYHRSLIRDLSDELTTTEYTEMLAIKNAKPEKAKDAKGKPKGSPVSWAIRIKAALDYSWLGGLPGTDEDAIKAVFREFPYQKSFWDTAYYFKKKYGQNLIEALDGDVSSWSFDWRKELHKLPKSTTAKK